MSRNDELIAALLGDAPATAELQRWLRTSEGRAEGATCRKILDTFTRAFAKLAATPPEIAFSRTMSTPLGRVFFAVTARGLVRLSFARRDSDPVADLRHQLGLTVLPGADETGAYAEQIRAYLDGTRRRFELQVDLRLATPFQRRVLAAARRIPRGSVASYADLARRIGQPGASRAVGQALGRNPVPLVIPCHRIVASGGRLGGYAFGPTIKRRLLALEAA